MIWTGTHGLPHLVSSSTSPPDLDWFAHTSYQNSLITNVLFSVSSLAQVLSVCGSISTDSLRRRNRGVPTELWFQRTPLSSRHHHRAYSLMCLFRLMKGTPTH